MNCIDKNTKVHFVGISCFGPLELNPASKDYGNITSTPKDGWRDAPVLQFFKTKLQCAQVSIETDVNAAAFAEFKLGNHKAKESVAYITVGTGVGVGLVCHGKTVHGLTHPEGGHIMYLCNLTQSETAQGLSYRVRGSVPLSS